MLSDEINKINVPFQLTCKFIDVNDIPGDDRRQLLKKWYIVCNCVKCRRPEPEMACMNMDCLHTCDPEDVKCSACFEDIKHAHSDAYEATLTSTIAMMDKPHLYCIL